MAMHAGLEEADAELGGSTCLHWGGGGGGMAVGAAAALPSNAAARNKRRWGAISAFGLLSYEIITLCL